MTIIYDITKDPAQQLLARKREIERAAAALTSGENIDDKEIKEREVAAAAYAGENPQHFSSYMQDCIDQSVRANADIRKAQAHCYRVYLEDEPVNYAKKDAWQSRIVVPKPFGTVQSGASAIKRAFTPKFLSVTNIKDKNSGEFWKKVLDVQLNEQHAKFVLRFTDATTMALAIGISMEMIPRWTPGAGLSFSLIPPWQIHRDPDAASRDPQSGLYWIHQEWLDLHVLQAGETAGKYENVKQVNDTEEPVANNPWMTQEAIAARKGMIWSRSTYRPMVLTSEFWGTVLSPKGEMLLPTARFTTAAGRIIEKPKAVPYTMLRWPGIAFSPMPDLLKFNGRGLLEGVLTLWESMCNLMCLHQDNLQWIINPMTEINTDALVDPADTESWPGKEYLTHDSVNGQQAVRDVRRRSNTNDVLANMQYHDQNYQRGSFVTDAVQGLPGYRKDMTYREAAMNLDQALGVYSLMGENIESGAIYAIVAAAEFISRYATFNDYKDIFTDEELQKLNITPDTDPKSTSGVSGLPPLNGTFHISGIQALMKENETLTNIKNVIIPLATNPRFAQYIKPYKALKAIEVRTNMTDEGILVSEDEALKIEAGEYEQLSAQKKAAADAREIQDAHGVADLAAKINNISPSGAPAPATTNKEATT
jgi:hypothetical protein